ncbi:MAG: hypothetical protein IH899_19315 [Planctomycetes bacterium]|nr:hypothetical protein [Planctomycetota bacterium]
MRRFALVPPLVCLAILAWSLLSSKPQGDSVSGPAGAGNQLQSLVVSKPLRYGNLLIFPVSSKVSKNQDRFVTLDEGLKTGTVEIFEIGADGNRVNNAQNEPGESQQRVADTEVQNQLQDLVQQVRTASMDVDAEVNRLMVVNKSGKPLYLMPGEVIIGGSQDRTIAEETIIASSDKPVPLDVYCVEQGRWASRTIAETSEILERAFLASVDLEDVSLPKLAEQATRGKFVASAGSLSKASRLAVQDSKDQSAVWERIAGANTMRIAGANTMSSVNFSGGTIVGLVSTGAFTANYVDQNVLKQLEPYIDKLRKPISKRPKIVGVIVAINGKIESVDVFESTPLFRKLWPKLLKSYALDAVAVADNTEAKKTCTVADAKSFLKESLQANVEERTKTTGGLVVTKRASDNNIVSFSFGGGLVGFGGVHASAFSK